MPFYRNPAPESNTAWIHHSYQCGHQLLAPHLLILSTLWRRGKGLPPAFSLLLISSILVRVMCFLLWYGTKGGGVGTCRGTYQPVIIILPAHHWHAILGCLKSGGGFLDGTYIRMKTYLYFWLPLLYFISHQEGYSPPPPGHALKTKHKKSSESCYELMLRHTTLFSKAKG